MTSDSTDAHAVVASEAGNDGFVAETCFARWNPSPRCPSALVHVILGGPVEKRAQDFFAGFIAGAEAEQLRSSELNDDAMPFAIHWGEQVEISRGETEWIVGPQPGPWRPKSTWWPRSP